MGGYYNEADFNQLELWAYENLYRGGGMSDTADGRIALMAGSNLGGGTTVNWTNCLRTYPWVREEWEREHGLEGLERPGLRPHPRRRLRADQRQRPLLGLEPATSAEGGVRGARPRLPAITRNTDEEHYDPDLAGLLGFGDVSGAKHGTLKTYLQDAADAGAHFVVNCRVERVLVENGRAAGVEGTYVDAEGRTARVTVRAPTVVVAARRARDAGRAAALRHRRPGRRATTCACTRRPPSSASTTSRRRPGGARRSPGCRRRWPTSRTATAS